VDEQQAGSAVCVIGETVRRELFAGVMGRTGLGQQLRLKQFSCGVVGILAGKGQGGMGDQDDVVLVQFLIEAVVLSLIGGAIGIVLATVASVLLSGVMDVPYAFDPAINALSLLFSAFIGVAFGYFPARRAAQMDPIEALRHE
jgi:MacB-like periplasmic core domain/FtsX-like permease family